MKWNDAPTKKQKASKRRKKGWPPANNATPEALAKALLRPVKPLQKGSE